jgi:SAM-dependent methyltransferase
MMIGTEKTLEFLKPLLETPAIRLLEVGCGHGELASVLSQRIQVTAIDRSESAVLAAMQIGVEAQCVNFLEYTADKPFDIVVFARSLHHIQPLPAAIDKAFELLAADGKFVIEDFAAEQADDDTINWYAESRAQLVELGLLLESGRHKIDLSGIPLDWWHHHHFVSHSVSSSIQMRAAIETQFRLEQESFVPYLYRYLVDDLLSGVDTSEVAQAIFADEQRLCEQNRIRSIGYRLVATKK